MRAVAEVVTKELILVEGVVRPPEQIKIARGLLSNSPDVMKKRPFLFGLGKPRVGQRDGEA